MNIIIHFKQKTSENWPQNSLTMRILHQTGSHAFLVFLYLHANVDFLGFGLSCWMQSKIKAMAVRSLHIAMWFP